MAASFQVVAKLVNAALNAAGTYTATPSDPRFYTPEIEDAINNADGMVVEALCSNPSHPRRRDYLTSSVVANNAQVPTHLGPLEAVIIDGELGEPWPKGEIASERSNVLGLTTHDKHYWIDGSNTLTHNGTTATVHFCVYTRSAASPPVLQAPDEYTDAVACRAIAFLATPEGEDPGFASYYQQQWTMHLDAIRQAKDTPELQVYRVK